MGAEIGKLMLLNLLQSPGAPEFEDHVIIQAEFSLSPDQSSEFMFDFDGDEIFHVDMEKKETVWRLEEFGNFASFQAQGALANMAVGKANLDILIKCSNHTPNTNVPPEVTVLSNTPVELGEPNILICFINKFSPPVINVTWLQNGKPVTTGVSETVFLPRNDHLFRKFHYLPFVPSAEDVYDCKVEHWGLEEPLLKHWEYEAPTPLTETTENAVCALGLVVALVGIIVGTIFIIKGVRKGNTVEHRGPL
ncbi:HLA class II histocompatibility antigen, DR alpha chain-like [Pontoporia blainvillei]|uniref:HLA class II histocompatibility antigen, DR alpha chain-like n=1 Tax=Pontoporia blainvillei TaxID=48723 RepID=A0ABX0S8S4_PONBL|nr:HLA class II histocompatibility antigen, DR alpha chain-like [Pontoporia blainvillei]